MLFPSNRLFLPRATCGKPMDLVDRIIGGALGSSVSAYPAFNVWADNEGATVTSELPGVTMDGLDVTVQGKVVTVKGSRANPAAEDAGYLRRERRVGEFSRSFELPFQIDAGKVEAKLANGVLEISLPRAENDKPRKIAIATN